MKLQVTQANLAKALNTVARVANTRNALPILSNVLLKTENNRLSIAATNLDIGITHFIGSKINQEGAITVPARLMQDFIGSLPDSVLGLELTDNKLHITNDQYQSTINGIVADDFPVMPAIKGGVTWKTPAADFKKALSQVVFAASADDTRPVLNGVYFHSGGGQAVAVATDSYRLAEAKLGKSAKLLDFLMPSGAAQDLLRIISDTDKEIVITHDDQQAQFQVGDVNLVARLIEGNYPDYRKLIPTKFATVAKLARGDLLNIAKVSSLFARESAGSITLKADKDDRTISINAIASQLGENTAKAEAKITGGGEVTLNSRYLIEGLNAFSADEIEFCFNGKLEPCVIRSASEPDYLHLIMPLRS
ncbi:MAG TPA: DNA polymerase III subunit beta [Candidatus Saccharimonadales bacterium]|nr:DNA polymerase III subunit beta [Candidatus Saccharimonadales bacterium]